MSLRLKEILREKLREKGISVANLARKTGISRKTLDNWLMGQKPQDVGQLKKVADFFETSIDEICFGNTNKAYTKTAIEEHRDEINAGIFEVVLRRIK